MTTIRDVARAARVSQSTVSRTLSSPDMVHPATRTRVEAHAQRLGYRPNRAARGLITGRTGNLGLIVPDLSNPFFASVVKGIQSAARASDYSVFIADTDEEARAEVELLRALAKQVDGILLCSPRTPQTRLQEVGVDTPIVMMNRAVDGFPSVTVDNADGMRQAVNHLTALGHRRVAYVGGPSTSWSDSERRRGLRSSAETTGADLVDIGSFPPQFEGGVAAADLVLASGASAVIAYNDVIALGLMSRFTTRGVSVPTEVSVVGCDDIAMSSMSHPQLTTIAIPQHVAGRAAVGLLMSVLSDEEAESRQRELPTQLIVRASTAVAPT